MAVIVVVLMLVAASHPCSANTFLERVESELVNQSTLEQSLLGEVRHFMRQGYVDTQLDSIRTALEPMWMALPKNQHGKLDSGLVRYALRRFFVQRHGWHLDGLDDSNSSFEGASSPAGLLRERAPTFLMDRFEEAFGKSGLMLFEVVIFAATLEHIIHDEAADRLRETYEALETSTSAELSDDDVEQTMDVYMLSLLMGRSKLKAKGTIEKKLSKLAKKYPGWTDTQLWLRDVQQTVGYLQQGARNPFKNSIDAQGLSFRQVEHIVTEVSERFGGFQNNECRHLKDTLLEAEDGGTGRVRLSDFYSKALESSLRLNENTESLRQLGALDESKAGEPRVIVANYLLSQGNCLAETGFYSICCISECEGLLTHLERGIAAPFATAEQIIALVANLSSSTVEAPRVLTEAMTKRLHEVAARSGGRVALHGRLFGQWLHFVFPRECPFPQNTNLKVTQQAMDQSSVVEMKPEHMEEYIKAMEESATPQQRLPKLKVPHGHVSEATKDMEELLLAQWSNEEALLYMRPSKQSWKIFSWLQPAKLVWLVIVPVVVLAGSDAVKRLRGARGDSAGMSKVHLV